MRSFLLVLTHVAILSLLATSRAGATDFTRFLADPAVHIEGNRATDRYGNPYELRFGPLSSSKQDISLSELEEAIGLPNRPVYPIIAKDPKGEWVRGTIMPLARGSIDEDPVQSYARSLLEWVAGRTTAPKRPDLAHLREATADQFVARLNPYLTRLEKLSPTDVRKIFPTETTNEVLARIAKARTRALEDLENGHLRPEALSSLQNASNTPSPSVNLPSDQEKSEVPVDRLWKFYFRAPDAPEKSELPALFASAAKDTTKIYNVAPHMKPRFDAPQTDTLAQLSLNPKNGETLVVVPLNDAEAREIYRISKASGAHTLALDGKEYPHGAKLSEALLGHIQEELRKNPKITRVAVVELPGNPLRNEEKLKANVRELFIVDHHEQVGVGGVDRLAPKSSLEQISEMLGYKLSPTGKAIAVRDRSYLYGLADLGVAKSDLGESKPPLQRTYPSIETDLGPVYIVRESPSHGGQGPKMAELADVLAREHYPEIPNILVIGREGIQFSGRKAFIDRFRALVGRVGPEYTGGDPARASFWGLRGVGRSYMATVESKILGAVRAREIGSAGCVEMGMKSELLSPR